MCRILQSKNHVLILTEFKLVIIKCSLFSRTQIIMAILVSWLLCFIFTVTDVFPPEVDKYGFYARTDARQGILVAAPWFKIPYPCKCVYTEEGLGDVSVPLVTSQRADCQRCVF